MHEIGHFPMAENYPLFRTYLMPYLQSLSDSDLQAANRLRRLSKRNVYTPSAYKRYINR